MIMEISTLKQANIRPRTALLTIECTSVGLVRVDSRMDESDSQTMWEMSVESDNSDKRNASRDRAIALMSSLR